MNKLGVNIILIATTLFSTACNNIDEISSRSAINSSQGIFMINDKDKSKHINSKINQMPIEVKGKDGKKIKYIDVEEESTLQEKIDLIVKAISKECFNGLTIKATIYGNDSAIIELKEFSDSKNSRISWKTDYLNEDNIEETVNTIVKNILQEQYNGMWIKTVQLYYEDELITI